MHELRPEFERDGFVVVEAALSRNELDTLSDAVDEIWSRRANGQTLHQLAFIGLHPSFVELVDHSSTLPLVCDVLGWNIFLYHCHLDVHPPVREPRTPRWGWHQDGGRQNIDLESPRPRLSVKVAYFLTSVERAEHGALWVIPGSHRKDALSHAQAGSRPSGAIPLLVRAGSAVIFDRRLWHARGDNTSDRTRKALFYAYTYRWIRMRDDLPGIDDALLARCDPIRRQLLGAGDSAFGYWFPQDGEAPLRSRLSA
jgi:ectoine hydroxylase